MSKIIESLKKINYKMFLALLLFGLIPTIYTTFRIFLIGQLPGDYSFSIAGQLQWVNLIYEIIQEALILPLFFFIGSVLQDKEELKNRIKTGLLFAFGIYLALSIIIIVFAEPLVRLMATDKLIINETVNYIRLETVSFIFSTLVKFIMVVLVTIKKTKNVYFTLIVQLVLTVLLDVFLVSTLKVSANLGINGIAISNITVNVILLIISFLLLYKSGITIIEKKKLDFKWIKGLIKTGGISGLESFVRNMAFMIMIVRMVNVVGEQGTFWVANSFIYGWLLLPVIQLGELVKADTGEKGFTSVKEKTLGYFAITSGIVILWLITIPLWIPFLSNALQLGEIAKPVFDIALISLGFYILFAFNNVIDSIFYGMGKTNLMLYQSVIINFIFYGTLFILYQLNVIQPNLLFIALMFAIGTGLDSILTFGIFWWVLKKKKQGFADNVLDPVSSNTLIEIE